MAHHHRCRDLRRRAAAGRDRLVRAAAARAQTLLRRNRAITVEAIDPLPLTGILRFNHLHPPFNDKRIRQAILPAIDQADYMAAIVAPMRAVQTGAGVFTPGTPLANDAGLGPLTGPRSIDRGEALLREAGYTNQPIRLIGPTDIVAPAAMTQVAGDMFRRLGVNLDFVLTDWGTVVQRRSSREPLEKGGWSALLTSFSSFDFLDPAGHTPLRGNGAGAWPGWPTIPRLEALRDAWFDAPDLSTQQRLAREIQEVAMDELPFVPVGAYMSITALRRNITGRRAGLRHLLEHEARMIGRRALLGAGGGLLAAPALSQPTGARVLRFVPQADLRRAGPDRDLLQRHPQPWLHGLGHALWRGRRIPRASADGRRPPVRG